MTVNQTLHGYRDGHQLLASTTQLTADQRWQLLVQSDLIGSFEVNTEESYLIGYPIIGGGLYCLARTWYARELERPGCVWTQTFLISDTALAQVRDFRSFLPYFTRPSQEKGFQAYAQKLTLAFNTLGEHKFGPETASAVLEKLYGNPDEPLVIENVPNDMAEDICLGVMNQQWPRLRRHFRFSAGVLGMDKTGFDLSTVPETIRSRHSLKQSPMQVLSLRDPQRKLLNGKSWLSIASLDLLERDTGSSYREFLWSYGPDFSNGRAAFARLSYLFLVLQDKKYAPDEVLLHLSGDFGGTENTSRILRSIFEPGGKYSTLLGSEYEIIYSLVLSPNASHIDPEITQIKRRAIDLAQQDFSEALKIAEAAVDLDNSTVESFLDGFAESIENQFPSDVNISHRLMARLIRIRISLLASERLWEAVKGESRECMLEGLTSLDLGESLLREIIVSAINVSAEDVLESLVNRYKLSALSQIASWCDESEFHVVSSSSPVANIIHKFSFHVSLLLESKPVGPRFLALISCVVQPDRWRHGKTGIESWCSIIDSAVEFSTEADRLNSSIFLLSLAIAKNELSASRIFEAEFQFVFDKLRNDLIPHRQWIWLESLLPFDWSDRGSPKRFVHGVTYIYMRRNYNAKSFLTVFAASDVFRISVAFLRKSSDGRRYLRNLLMELDVSHLSTTSYQYSSIRKAVK